MEVLSAGMAARTKKGDINTDYNKVDTFGIPATSVTVGTDESNSLALNQIKLWDGKDKTLEDCIFEIGGKKFVMIDKSITDGGGNTTNIDVNAPTEKMNAAGIACYKQVMAANTVSAADAVEMGKHIATATGMTVETGTNNNGVWEPNPKTPTGTEIRILSGSSTTSGGGNGLTLQIGDTSDKFNQMKVFVGDMHTNAMGKGKATLDGKEINVTKTIADIDIGTQEGAAEAVQVIKNAINYVSSVRGDLGAVQNRLDHTANNLSVMAENIQDAESTIRDTDVANEMMS